MDERESKGVSCLSLKPCTKEGLARGLLLTLLEGNGRCHGVDLGEEALIPHI